LAKRKQADSDRVVAAGSQVRLLIDALKIYSPTTEEAGLASFLTDRMEGLGYSRVRIDRAGNAIGEIGRGDTRLLLCGHMDTVPGRLPVRKTADAVYGRGAADAKSPLCALLLAGAASADSGVRVTFVGATQEEGEGAGIEQLISSGAEFDYAIFGEPSGSDRITVGYRGRVSLHVKVRTAGGHAGSSWAHKSAYEEFNTAMSKLREYEAAKQIPGDHFNSLSVTPTLIKSGIHHNVVPGLCEATLDLRLPPSIQSSTAIEEIRRIIEKSEDGVSVDVVPGELTEAYETDTGSMLIRALERAIILKLKTKPKLIRKTGTGDMNTFAYKRHAECVTYGPGLSATSHTDGEVVRIKDYLNSIEVLKEAVRQLAALHSRDKR
jgi:[amino group carrier protein]-lysine/ornithine hydrolase